MHIVWSSEDTIAWTIKVCNLEGIRLLNLVRVELLTQTHQVERLLQYQLTYLSCENTPIQMYWKFYHQKMKIFR